MDILLGRNEKYVNKWAKKSNVHLKNEVFLGRSKRLTLKGLLGELPVFEIFFF